MFNKEFDFKILSFSNPDEMEAAVKKMLGEGWELHGDLKAVAQSGDSTILFVQALVKNITPRGTTGFKTSMQS